MLKRSENNLEKQIKYESTDMLSVVECLLDETKCWSKYLALDAGD